MVVNLISKSFSKSYIRYQRTYRNVQSVQTEEIIWAGLVRTVKFKFRRFYHMFYHMEAIFDRSGDCSGNGFRLIQVGSNRLYNLLTRHTVGIILYMIHTVYYILYILCHSKYLGMNSWIKKPETNRFHV